MNQQPTTENVNRTTCNEGATRISRYTIHDSCYASRGFTLVEMIVALFIFSVVMVVSTGALVSIIEANRKAQSVKSVMNNVSFAVDSMMRNLRVGTGYEPGPQSACSGNGASSLTFTDVDGRQVRYRLSANQIERSIDSGMWLAMTAPEVSIERLCFYVDGTSSGDAQQPRVLILVGGVAGQGRSETPFDIQTLVSQRILDR